MHSNLSVDTRQCAILPQSGWHAHLQLGFTRRYGKTVLTTRDHSGPLTIQRPFYPEGDVCHVYLLHPPGGVVAGDRLSITASALVGANALLTTPAAGKFYRSEGGEARQSVSLTVENEASLEWLPQETIIYQGARLTSDVQIDLAEHGRFVGWEINVFGRPAAGEGFAKGMATLNWRISRAERLLYLERQRLGAKAFQGRWGLAGHVACGTMFVHPVLPLHLVAVQDLIGDAPNRGVTVIEGLLICRGLDSRSDLLKAFFEKVWALLRENVIGREICLPRIWAT
ncbi:MAG: urease accessory protein UreD [Methylomonas sp.]|nr:urease accessory protein UreD [Methylomonas sp.]PPD19568.1 MAG: urease accessory protein [Methylomonas sp.]PPD24723.1 MAG: urease accessory protein [Methylomonas sp.]PPD33333.1 MAG: urease accessory protein [Methylomonas sp.]PPD38740.1 MAG: urease accessory protein [Methylomonas sp.]